MENDDNTYQQLINHASSALGIPEQELKNRYKGYPICFMEYIESGIAEHVIEVRFDSEFATLSLTFNDDNVCDCSFLFFDTEEEVDLFLGYMIDTASFNFRDSNWKLVDCYLRLKTFEKETTAFYFHK